MENGELSLEPELYMDGHSVVVSGTGKGKGVTRTRRVSGTENPNLGSARTGAGIETGTGVEGDTFFEDSASDEDSDEEDEEGTDDEEDESE